MFQQLLRLPLIYLPMDIPRPLIAPILALAVVAAGCGGSGGNHGAQMIIENPFEAAAQADGAPVAFELDGSFGVEDTPEEAILDFASSSAVDESGNVYLLDRDNRIVSFDPDGTLRWEMTAQGEGPGELNRPWGMVMGPDDLLYVNNQSATRLDMYDLDGSHVGAISPETFGHQRFSLIGFPNDSTAVGTVFEPGRLGTRIVVVDAEGEWTVRNEMMIDQTGDIKMPEGMSGAPTVELYEDQLAVTNVTRYEITLMSLEGDTLRMIRRDVPDYLRPGFHRSGNSVSMRMFSNTSAPINLPTGHRLVQARWPTNVDDPDGYTAAGMSGTPPEVEYHRTLDLYDADWNLVYSIRGDEHEELSLGSPALVDRNGFLYTTRSTPWPRLDRNSIKSVNK